MEHGIFALDAVNGCTRAHANVILCLYTTVIMDILAGFLLGGRCSLQQQQC